jgi:hypothetical protein
MPDPIPRNRSAHGRRGRRLARQRGWRGAFRRTLDNDGAEPGMPQQCTFAGPALRLDQPLRRAHEHPGPTAPPSPAPADQPEQPLPAHDNTAPLPPLPAPPAPVVHAESPPRPPDGNTDPAPPRAPALRTDPPLPSVRDNTEQASSPRPPLPALRPHHPLRRTHDNAEQAPPPPQRPPAGPLTRPPQPLQRVRANAEPPRPRAARQRRAGTDVVIGASLVASVALVVGLTLPLLSSGAPSNPAALPPASEHASAAPAPDSQNNPGARADQPAAVAAVNHGPARGPVTLLADRTAAAPGMPVQLPAPAQPAGVAGPVLQVESQAGDPGHRQAGTGYPGPGREAGPPPPSIHPDPPSEYEREQLARLAKLLAQLPSSPVGTTAPGGSTFPKGGGTILPKGAPKSSSLPKSTPNPPKSTSASPGGSQANFGGGVSPSGSSANRLTGPAGSGRSGGVAGPKAFGGTNTGGSNFGGSNFGGSGGSSSGNSGGGGFGGGGLGSGGSGHSSAK